MFLLIYTYLNELNFRKSFCIYGDYLEKLFISIKVDRPMWNPFQRVFLASHLVSINEL